LSLYIRVNIPYFTSYIGSDANRNSNDLSSDPTLPYIAEQKRLNTEISDLRAKLRWYAENQELLEKGDSERFELKKTVRVLKAELRRAKLSGGTGDIDDQLIQDVDINDGLDDSNLDIAKHREIGKFSRINKKNTSPSSNVSFNSFNSNNKIVSGGGYKRDPADIKKIKYQTFLQYYICTFITFLIHTCLAPFIIGS
jgi:hypothetical protein